MPVHNAVARNFAEASENKIHSDDIAKRFRKPDSSASAQSPAQTFAQSLARSPARSATASSWLSGGSRAQTGSGLPVGARRHSVRRRGGWW